MSLFDFAHAKKLLTKTLALGSLAVAMFGAASTKAEASTLPVHKAHARTVTFNTSEIADKMSKDSTYHVAPMADSLAYAETPILVLATSAEAAPLETLAPAKVTIAKKGYTHKTYSDRHVTKKLYDHLKQREGVKSFIYPDCRGLPTTGVGHYLSTVEDAKSRPWRLRNAPDQLASKKQIAEAYDVIAHMGPCKTADDAKDATGIFLKSDYVDEMLKKDVRYVTTVIKRNMPFFDKMPEPAKEAVETMGFAVGPNRMVRHSRGRNAEGRLVEKGFPRLFHALETGDMKTAAKLCSLRGVGEKSNKMTRDLFLEAEEILRQDRLEVATAAAQAKQVEMQAAANVMNMFSTPTATGSQPAYYLQLTDLRR